MKALIRNHLLILVLVGIGAAQAAEGEAVVNPAKRQEVLSMAKALLATPSPAVVSKDPFNSEDNDEIVEGPREPNNNIKASNPNITTRDLLQAIATSPSAKPSGNFVLGGQPTLVFGSKRLKAGGILKITYNSTEYALEIVSIVPPNFTLRLHGEEFTRTIK